MNKKTLRKILILVAIIAILLSFINITYGAFGIDNIKGKIETSAKDDIMKAGNNIVKVITTIGTIISVAMLIALGIKYMMGSAEEKASYKKSLLPYVIGASIVFAASVFAQMVYNFATTL